MTQGVPDLLDGFSFVGKSRKPCRNPKGGMNLVPRSERDAGFPWRSFEQVMKDTRHEYMRALDHAVALVSPHVTAPLICLGIGCFTTSLQPRCQLAFLLKLHAASATSTNPHPSPIVLYDPDFSDSELEFIATHPHLACPNPPGSDPAIPHNATVYCPHCPMVVNNRVVAVPGVVFIGNDLTQYDDGRSSTGRDEVLEMECRQAMQRRATCVEVTGRGPDAVRRALQGTAVQTFNTGGEELEEGELARVETQSPPSG